MGAKHFENYFMKLIIRRTEKYEKSDTTIWIVNKI